MHTVRPLTTLALCAAVLCFPAQAGIGQGNGEIGFDIGGTDYDSNLSDEGGGLFAVRGGWHVTDLFQLEGQFAASVVEEGPVTKALGLLFMNGVFTFRAGTEIRPYVLAGLGRANLTVEVAGFEVDDDSGAFQFAAGSRFFVGPNRKMAIRVELSSVREETFGEASTHGNFSVGLTWRIGPGKDQLIPL